MHQVPPSIFHHLPLILHNFVQVGYRITRLPLFRSMFLSPMLLERVVTRELLLTRRTHRSLLGTCWSMFLSNMIVHFLLIVSGILTFSTRNNSFSTSFLMSGSVYSSKHVSAVLTFDFLISVKCRHYLKKIGTFEMFQI